MTITAKVILDSVNEHGNRLVSVELRYPRFIHAELMTHRVFSRNSSSSRAIPVDRLIQDCLDDTAMPSHWGKNQPGMQAKEELDAPVWIHPIVTPHYEWCEDVVLSKQEAWLVARDNAVYLARSFSEAGYHKQIVNRLLEPFVHINVLVTSTEWSNFFELRNHEDAQPEIKLLAQAIHKAMGESTPQPLSSGDWHVPYVTDEDRRELNIEELKMISAARCARVSYKTHDNKIPSRDADLTLYDRLAAARPRHLSPTEHQAQASEGRIRNFIGWKQFRVEIDEEAAY